MLARNLRLTLPFFAQAVLLLIATNVFMTFAMVYVNQPFKLDCVWAGCCLVGVVYFVCGWRIGSVC